MVLARRRNEPLFSTTPHFFPPKENEVNAKKEKKTEIFSAIRKSARRHPRKITLQTLKTPIPRTSPCRMFGATNQQVSPPNRALT